ncbi:putative RNA methyltransferase [Conexibacter sp. SYSU D00693]|uniref:putative RNA methyltransferase n=1 Tax=Conexibacter sp. SYSU D00693 TaxID=2812560 RepID=UPI00196B14C8|nr:methyltransferase domain-containing protein [Conexibacter sp. SYSU D00693]
MDDVLDLLRCPVCGAALARDGGALRCEAGHAFDVARQGFVTLLPGDAPAHPGDTAAMVQARDAVVAAGHLTPLSVALAEVVARAVDGVDGAVVDLGAGTGHHLAAVLDGLPQRRGLALDRSKPALRRAARIHPRAAAIGADAWSALPVRDGVAAAVLSVFAPRSAAEVARVLAPGGAFVVATPAAEHLGSLVRGLGLLAVDPAKDARVREALETSFALESSRRVAWPLSLSRDEAVAFAAMGPSAFHVGADELEARAAGVAEPLETSGVVDVAVWRAVRASR